MDPDNSECQPPYSGCDQWVRIETSDEPGVVHTYCASSQPEHHPEHHQPVHAGRRFDWGFVSPF